MDNGSPSLQASGSHLRDGFKGVKPYAIVLVTLTFVVVLRGYLDPVLQDHHPFVLFLSPVLLAVWIGGWRPAVFATGLGCLVVKYCFIPSRETLGFDDFQHVLGAAFFILISTMAIVLAELVRAAERRAESQADLLRAEVAKHERTQEQLRHAKADLERYVEQRTAELSHINSQLHQEENARRAAETKVHRLAAIVASSEDAIVGKDLNGVITDWNAGAEHLFGYAAEEVIGRHFSVLIPLDRQDDMPWITERLQQGKEVHPHETVRLGKDGRETPVSVRMSPIKEGNQVVGLASIHRDLTHAKRLEEQLRQSQKMEAIGQLAGGVAHDFNNILTIINGCTELILTRLHPDDRVRNLLQQIRDAGERAASLTHQLLAFSRKQVLQPKVVDLNETVRHSEKMLRRLLGEDVQLTTTLDANLRRVKIDPGQFDQVIVNLAVNARDAMPQGGKLTIETANVDLSGEYADSHPEVRPGRYVLLAVSDNGTGMDEKVKAHIFEPFFTTKEVGKGTGLGLPMVHGIVKQSGGHIAVYSEPGHGTTFKIYLPAVEGTRVMRRPYSWIETAPKGAETILLVEDEESVRRLTRLSLQMSGYTVLEACHGGEAVQLAETYQGPIHLLVSDVVMPEMGGRLLAERLATVSPDIKVLFVSGYTDDAVVRHGVLEAGVAFLQKPFSPGALAQKVREVLDSN